MKLIHDFKYLFVVALSIWLTLPIHGEIELTLEKALARAAKANYSYLIERGNLQIAQEKLRSSQSDFYPDLTLESRQQRSMASSLNTNILTPLPNRQYLNRFETVIRSRLELLNFETFDSVKINRIGVRIAERQLEDTIQLILQEIGFAYYDYWRDQRRLTLLDARIERSKTLLQIARTREEAGVATPLDVTRAEVDLQENELEKLQQETVLLQSELDLKRILALPLDERIVLPDLSINPELIDSSSLNTWIEKALQQRADFQVLELELEQSETALSATRRERLPTLALSGEWGYGAEKWDDDLEETWQIGIGLEWPLFEGFRTQANERADRVRIEQNLQRLNSLREQIEADIRIAFQNKQSRAQQVEVARKSVTLNQREFSLAKFRFEEGVADNSDVVNAQVGLATAEDRLIESEYFYMRSLIRWSRVAGVPMAGNQ